MLDLTFVFPDHETDCHKEDSKLAIVCFDKSLRIRLDLFELLYDPLLAFVCDDLYILNGETLLVFQSLLYLQGVSLRLISIINVDLLEHGIICVHFD